jgi:hypothetical protein
MKHRIAGTCLALFAVALLAAGIAVQAGAGDGKRNDKGFEYAVGLWGDMPYSAEQAATGVPNLIADMNNQELAFTINDGDLKAGGNTLGALTCADALYDQALGYLGALKEPAILTPGDNDWTDCDRPANGGFNSRERLDKERQVFFSTNRSLGQETLKQDVQTAALCLNAAGTSVGCVENRRWTMKKVTYATVNLPGSCNNLCDTAPDTAEYTARNNANIVWLQETFAAAKAKDSAGLMIVGQANPGFDLSDATRAPIRDPKTLVISPAGTTDGYQEFLAKLRELTVDFRKPVVFVHGDSHYFRVDRPLLASDGKRLENFTRVETFGDNAANGNNDVHWVKVLVDAKSRDVFAFQAQIVPANRVAVPAP